MTAQFLTKELARLYEDQGYMEEAVAYYQALLEQHPDSLEIQEALVRVEKSMGDKKPEKAEPGLEALIAEWTGLVLKKHRLDTLASAGEFFRSCRG